MKIAIITLPIGANYGGIMQAWAMQHVLKQLGHDPITIDRQLERKNALYGAARLGYRSFKKAIGRLEEPIIPERKVKKIVLKNIDFINKNIIMSEKIDSSLKMKQHFRDNVYDTVIVGSDQVWRPKYTPDIFDSYCNFIEQGGIRRLAYAPSFGVGSWEYDGIDTERIEKLLSKFYAVSVREKSGQTLLRKYFSVEAKQVLDPTMLVDKSNYDELLADNKYENIPCGVFVYFLDKSEYKVNLANDIARELKKDIGCCESPTPLKSLDLEYIKKPFDLSVMGWLSSLRNAEFIVTDSFHGLVFSLIFDKPVAVVINKKRGSERFYSILSMFKNGRCYVLEEGQDFRIDADAISAHSSDILWFDRSKVESLEFLRQSLS